MISLNRVLIFGSTGQLGSDLILNMVNEFEVIPITHDMVNVENADEVREIILKNHPNYVVNATAFHNVKKCENNPPLSYSVNCIALKSMIDTCNEIEAVFVHFSTNYVFGDKNRNLPYKENDATVPVNIYGLSKLAGERLITAYCKKWYIFRLSGLFGLKGSSAKKYKNFVELMIDLGVQNEEIPSNDEERFTFTSTKTVSKVVKKMIISKQFGLYHLTNLGDSTRMEFASEIFHLLNIKCKLIPVNSSHFNPGFIQPKYTVLDCSKIRKQGIELPHWREALAEYLEERKLVI